VSFKDVYDFQVHVQSV